MRRSFPSRFPEPLLACICLRANSSQGGRRREHSTHLDLVEDDKGTLHCLDGLVLCGGPRLDGGDVAKPDLASFHRAADFGHEAPPRSPRTAGVAHGPGISTNSIRGARTAGRDTPLRRWGVKFRPQGKLFGKSYGCMDNSLGEARLKLTAAGLEGVVPRRGCRVDGSGRLGGHAARVLLAVVLGHLVDCSRT